MKTNRCVRRLLKVQVILFCLAVVGMAGVGICLGQSLTVQRGQADALRTGGPQAPSVGLAEAMVAALR
jgi:hypothetical protein